MKIWIIFWLVMTVSACDSSTDRTLSEEITKQFRASGRTFVNLSQVVPHPWDRVCIFCPYSDNKVIHTTLGFDWNGEGQSSIETNDSIALLLFVEESRVVEVVEHPRGHGDFTNLSRKCVLREHSTFYHKTNPKKGWPGLFPKL